VQYEFGIASSASAKRKPAYVSQGSTEVSITVDGVAAVTDVPIGNGSAAGVDYPLPQGQLLNLKTQVSNGNNPSDPPGMTYFTVLVGLTMIPGNHNIGVVLLGAEAANQSVAILSEGWGAYDFTVGPNTLSPLVLHPVVASGYIQCDLTSQNTTDGTCGSYANYDAAAHAYRFTAVAADSSGYPIATAHVGADYAANEAGLTFDNGDLRPVETDSLGILSISGGPWSTPGQHYATAPGTMPAATYSGPYVYGNAFSVQCLKTGTAYLGLQLGPGGATFANSPAGNPDGPKFPAVYANTTVPLGLLTATTPYTIFQQSVTVNCTAANVTLPVI
jgi:hypothetical protein